ncbi:hypothetical protein RJ639_040525 [Escallonia herrerae]|uniref:FAR1 domain-containing protein n=1 Tax=Escallonia herrerae TaxID=1293975 RepID=A0AA88WRC2_9ASTE|nr:hypothetical protein RJ639_040525 [Escallonia herrerae]
MIGINGAIHRTPASVGKERFGIGGGGDVLEKLLEGFIAQPVIDCEKFDIANGGELGAENHEEGIADLGVVPFEYNEGETRDGERCEDFEECSEETVIGNVFGGQEEVYEFYNQYALVKGFDTRIHYSHKNRMTNEIFRTQFVCNKQGFKKLDDKRQFEKQLKCQRDTRTGCGAMKQITL